MEKENKLVADSREKAGSAEARRLRRKGRLPGIVNNDKGGSLMIALDRHGFELMLGRHSSENLILDIEVDGKDPLKVLLKDVQHHPVTGEVLHVDFIEISMTKKMRVRIPVMLVGEAPGVLQEGGVLEQLLRELEVECLPTDLVETIEADISALKLNESLLVESLRLDPKFTLLTDKKLAIAAVTELRAEEEVTPEAAAAGAAEPEVIGRVKKEGEEEGEAAEGAEDGKKKKEEPKKGEAGKKPEAGKPEAGKKETGKKEDAKPEAGKKKEGKQGK